MPTIPSPALVRQLGRVALALALAATTGLADDLAPRPTSASSRWPCTPR
jgi:hypothetical protein